MKLPILLMMSLALISCRSISFHETRAKEVLLRNEIIPERILQLQTGVPLSEAEVEDFGFGELVES
jgi:hypothetical protein